MSRTLIIALALLVTAGCTTAGDPGRVAEASHRADLHARLAATYMERGQMDVAREEIAKALDADPSSSFANHVMAVMQSRLGNTQRADDHFRRALRSDPDNYDAMFDYGLFLCSGERPETGVRQLERLIRAPENPRQVLSHAALGECHVRSGDLAGAEEAYRNALSANPRQGSALFGMAQLMLEKGNALSARAHLERYFEVGPVTPDSLVLGYRIEKEMGSDSVADDYARRLRQEFPDSSQAAEIRAQGN